MWDWFAQGRGQEPGRHVGRHARPGRRRRERRHSAGHRHATGGGRRLSGRRLPAHQAQDQAGLGHRTDPGRPRRRGPISSSRWTPTASTVWSDAAHLAGLDGFQSVAHRTAAGPRRHLRPCQAEATRSRRLSVWTKASSRPTTRAGPSSWTRATSSTSSRGASAGWPIRYASTIWPRTQACRSGTAACWRPASAAPSTSRWPVCPTSRLPGDISANDRYYARDIVTNPFTLNTEDSTLTVPTGIGSGAIVDEEFLDEVTLARWEFKR